uniref:Uncharacterized protein n=1 Tax=Daphnia galeata TaxID=27404 RepID=A0A8J2WP43_9CRUS|nr:unnamed protein product [Daphnia galeata]
MSDQPELPCPTSSFVTDEGTSFSFTWNSSSLSTQDEIFRPYNNAGLFADSSANLLGPGKKCNMKSNYRQIPHIPHSVRPAFQVARRNARERRRVQSVSQCCIFKTPSGCSNRFRRKRRKHGRQNQGPAGEDVRTRRSSKLLS